MIEIIFHNQGLKKNNWNEVFIYIENCTRLFYHWISPINDRTNYQILRTNPRNGRNTMPLHRKSKLQKKCERQKNYWTPGNIMPEKTYKKNRNHNYCTIQIGAKKTTRNASRLPHKNLYKYSPYHHNSSSSRNLLPSGRASREWQYPGEAKSSATRTTSLRAQAQGTYV